MAALASEAPPAASTTSFLGESVLRRAKLPGSFELPDGWTYDPWSYLAAGEFAGRFGYAMN